MKVGLILPMSDDDGRGVPSWPEIRDLARQAEAGGADSVWVASGRSVGGAIVPDPRGEAGPPV